MGWASVGEVRDALAREHYLADEALATAVYLAGAIDQPLLLEGEAGVGKTETARAAAAARDARLVRLQCHEGIDVHHALYDWDWSRQLLALRAAEHGRPAPQLYSREFLVRRPLLEALEADDDVVLLIDEVDRADDAFEAFLLEFLSDFQITIPELGTVAATERPVVVMTSNRTRELHDALKRRCLYHWIPFPEAERERRIVGARAPGVDEAAAAALVEAVTNARGLKLLKRPGIAESIEWAQGAHVLAEEGAAWPDALRRSLGLLLKEQDDVETALAHAELLGLT